MILTKEDILWLLARNNFVSDDRSTIVDEFTNLLKLDLDQNPISDVGLRHLSNNA